jgi:hypothetical protein
MGTAGNALIKDITVQSLWTRWGEFNFVTIVESDSPASNKNAKAAEMAMHKQMNFNPQALLPQLGIKVDPANYRQVDA